MSAGSIAFSIGVKSLTAYVSIRQHTSAYYIPFWRPALISDGSIGLSIGVKSLTGNVNFAADGSCE